MTHAPLGTMLAFTLALTACHQAPSDAPSRPTALQPQSPGPSAPTPAAGSSLAPGPATGAAAVPVVASSAAAPPTAPSSAPPAPGTHLVLTGDELGAHALPRLGFSLDIVKTGFLATKFPGGDIALYLSGPPGGPLGIGIGFTHERAHDAAMLTKWIKAHNERGPLELGKPTQVQVGGAPRTALPYVIGESMARTSSCAFVIEAQPPGPEALVVEVGVGQSKGAPDCGPALGQEWIARVLASLHWQ
jgi:hypothetical protein